MCSADDKYQLSLFHRVHTRGYSYETLRLTGFNCINHSPFIINHYFCHSSQTIFPTLTEYKLKLFQTKLNFFQPNLKTFQSHLSHFSLPDFGTHFEKEAVRNLNKMKGKNHVNYQI